MTFLRREESLLAIRRFFVAQTRAPARSLDVRRFGLSLEVF